MPREQVGTLTQEKQCRQGYSGKGLETTHRVIRLGVAISDTILQYRTRYCIQDAISYPILHNVTCNIGYNMLYRV